MAISSALKRRFESEVTAFNALVLKVYKDFGFNDVVVKLSMRPESRVGSDEIWDKAEAALRAALTRFRHDVGYELPGEGAFYGPKIEFPHQGLPLVVSGSAARYRWTSPCRGVLAPNLSMRTTPARYR